MKTLRIIFLLLLLPFSLVSQDWIRYYGLNENSFSRYCIEAYDKGYMICGATDSGMQGWLIKTDINGNQLWSRQIGNGINFTHADVIEKTVDNGIILCGSTTIYNPPQTDPYIMKLNPCGDVEWCKVLVLDTAGDIGISVKQMSDGSYLLCTILYGSFPDNIINLFKFDSGGNPVWRKIYNHDSIINSEFIENMYVDDSTVLLSGYCYYPNWSKPYYIQTDTAGNENWRLVYSQHTGSGFVGGAYSSSKNSYGSYYSAGFSPNSPALLKFSKDGYEMMTVDLFPSSSIGNAATILIFNDTSLVTSAGWNINSVPYYAIIKTDTLGNQRKLKDLPNPANVLFPWTTKTFDNKIILVNTEFQGSNSRIVLMKFNSDLEYDSIYTRHFTYDSLCSHPIVSGTIVPNCGVLVNVNEPFDKPETAALKVFPNPARSQVTVEFPKHLVVKNSQGGLSSTTIYDKWKSTMLEVYDLSGKKIFEKEVVRAQNTLELNVSKWQSGMYYFRLVFNDRKVGEAMVVVE
jgi:hypothetical protein